jgi:hypothetical protein
MAADDVHSTIVGAELRSNVWRFGKVNHRNFHRARISGPVSASQAASANCDALLLQIGQTPVVDSSAAIMMIA